MKRQKYPLIVLWGRKLGSDPDYIKAEIRRATERNAQRNCHAAPEDGETYLCERESFQMLKLYNGDGDIVPKEDMDEVEALMDAGQALVDAGNEQEADKRMIQRLKDEPNYYQNYD